MFREEIPEVKIEGFQVVSRDLFSESQRQALSCRITKKNITFTKSSIVALGNCERIRIEINVDTRQLLATPVTQSDKDNVRWIKGVKDPSPRTIDCPKFTQQLIDKWSWEKEMVYRGYGKLISVDKKLMIMYDFSKPEKLNKKIRG